MATLRISPRSGTVGTRVSVKGAGFRARGRYEIEFGGIEVGRFEADARGSVPAGLRFAVPDLATSGERGELGTPIQVTVRPRGETDHVGASAPFELRASIVVDQRSAGTGFKVRVTGRGLLPEEFYYVTSVLGDGPDVAVAQMTTGPRGAGQAEFVVPPTLEPNEYEIQMKNMRGHYLSLRDPPSLGLLGYSSSSLVAGSPEGPASRPYCSALVTLPFKSRLSVPIVASVYAVIYKGGRPCRITSTAVNLAAGGSGEAPICFATVATGSYRVTAFAATMTGAIISEAISFPLTIEAPSPGP